MPKNSRRKEAALQRHRDKRGEQDPKEATELAKDRTYIDTPVEAPAALDSPTRVGEKIKSLARAAAAAWIPTKFTKNVDADLAPKTEMSATSRKHRIENADLIEHSAAGQSTTTLYREANNLTKKARAKHMQPSVANFFAKRAPKPVHKPTLDETDSDVEILSVHAPLIAAQGTSDPVPSDEVSEMELEAAVPEESITTESDAPFVAMDICQEPPIDAVSENAVPTCSEDDVLPTPMSTTAANKVADLEALRRFNDLRLVYLERLEVAKKRVRQAPPRCKAQMRKLIPKIKPALDAIEKVATVRRLGSCPSQNKVKVHFHATLLKNPEILAAVRIWASGALDFNEGGFEGRIKPVKLKHYVNDFLLPSLGIEDTISESTAVRWFKKLGFTLSRRKKGVYVDGHERKNVVESRNVFINFLYHSVLPFCNEYFRERADGTFPKAQKLVPEALDQVEVTNIRRYFRRCYRYMDAYNRAAYTVKKYTSHRHVPVSVWEDGRRATPK
ncbi:hypothetical protein B0H17DRAFT_1123570 [Mycena rosella]|uniref:Uncharacterized protein n=1 Tax=Mycena rosella TaxID=1033263 RepID=A0AAD7MCS5_MYCRO|nr:hypothetical protein B0H17DRAFT_1123570 [Mycena rosella]